MIRIWVQVRIMIMYCMNKVMIKVMIGDYFHQCLFSWLVNLNWNKILVLKNSPCSKLKLCIAISCQPWFEFYSRLYFLWLATNHNDWSTYDKSIIQSTITWFITYGEVGTNAELFYISNDNHWARNPYCSKLIRPQLACDDQMSKIHF